MKHPQTYLLEKITGYKTNGLSSLGNLNATHVNDIVSVMKSFAEETVQDIIHRVSKGEEVVITENMILKSIVTK